MSHYRVQGKSTKLHGSLALPSSKSQTLRAILFGMLGRGKTVVRNYLPSPDTSAMIEACRQLQTPIDLFPDRIEMEGCGGSVRTRSPTVINAGNSGLVLRLIGAVAALSNQPITLTGDHSICNNRPVQPLLDGLSQLGASAVSLKNNGFAPIMIQGPIRSGKASVSGEDSQPISGLLIASAFAQGPIEIQVNNPGERPWIELTLAWLDRLAISYERKGFSFYRVQGNSGCSGFNYSVPGDLSSLAFPLAAAIITRSALTIDHVDLSDPQGDKELIAVLRQMGAHIRVDAEKQQLHVEANSEPLTGGIFDINDYIDAIAILAVLGCFSEGRTELRNAAIARKKECDRIHCLAVELGKMGADIEELEDGLVIHPSKLKGASVDSHGDHRLAMALSVAALGAEGESVIHHVACVAKTYPNFCREFCQLGAKIEEFS